MKGQRLRERDIAPKIAKWLLMGAIIAGYLLVALAVMFFASRSGNYLDGVDAMFYVHRGDFLYKSITQEGNWFPLLDLSWYNGVQTWRYWSPLPAYILAGCQALRGGSVNDGFLLFSGILYFLDAVVWLHIGRTHKRPWLGALLGFLWFFVPNTTVQMLFSEGVLARAISMPVLPLFFTYVYDYLNDPKKRWSSLPKLMICFILILSCHIGWAGMVAISLLIYLLFYFLSHVKKEDRVMISPLVMCVLLSFVITGITLIPSVMGGITGLDSSDVMATYFQKLAMSINPFSFVKYGVWNRWLFAEAPYYGLTALVLTVLGILCAKKDVTPGFSTALAILLMSTPTAYQIIIYLPGNQYLWMTRFLSIALCIFLVSAFFWRSLKKWILGLFSVFFSVEVLCIIVLVTQSTNPLSPDAYHDHLAEAMLIDQGKAITTQRMSIIDPYDADIDGIYVIAGYGEERRATSFGQGVQAAVNYNNIVLINQAAETEQYLYLFDRGMELGNDTLIIPLRMTGDRRRNEEAVEAAARRVGYRLVGRNQDYLLYHLDAPDSFGVVSQYRAAAIGTGGGSIAVGFPAVQELDNIYLDQYTYEELEHYDVLYLAGFMYDNKQTAETLVRRLSENGTRILIMADGIPDDEHTRSKTFLGVSCNTVNFQNGYPALETIDGVLYCDLFPEGYSKDWKTVYLNGLGQVWGTITDVPEGRMDFYGTGENENQVFIGLALTYHYALTQDAAVGNLLAHALNMSPQELPRRELVPVSVDYRDNVITITSPEDNVNTTLAYHDIFRPDRPVRQTNHLAVVDRGTTTIRLVYPYLIPGLILSAAGLVATAVYLALMKKRIRKIEADRARQETDKAQAEEAKAESLRRGAELAAAQKAHDEADEALAQQEAQAKTEKLQAQAEEAGEASGKAGAEAPGAEAFEADVPEATETAPETVPEEASEAAQAEEAQPAGADDEAPEEKPE